MKGKRLKPGEVDLWRRRRYWEVFEKDKVVHRAQNAAAYEQGFRTACFMLLSDLKPESKGWKFAKEKAAQFDKYPFGNAPDAAEEFFDREAPKSLEKFMAEGKRGRKVVREDDHGPYQKSVFFGGRE